MANHWSGAGLENGADFAGALKHIAWLHQRDTVGDAEFLQTIVTGATWPRARLCSQGVKSCSMCERCGMAPEIDLHWYYDCPANDLIDDRITNETKS